MLLLRLLLRLLLDLISRDPTICALLAEVDTTPHDAGKDTM